MAGLVVGQRLELPFEGFHGAGRLFPLGRELVFEPGNPGYHLGLGPLVLLPFPDECLTFRLMDAQGSFPSLVPKGDEELADAVGGLGRRGPGFARLLASPIVEDGGDGAVAPTPQSLADRGGGRLATR